MIIHISIYSIVTGYYFEEMNKDGIKWGLVFITLNNRHNYLFEIL